MQTVSESKPVKSLEKLYELSVANLVRMSEAGTIEDRDFVNKQMQITQLYVKMRNNILNEKIFLLKVNKLLNIENVEGLKKSLKEQRL